jgi:hypothetical protein
MTFPLQFCQYGRPFDEVLLMGGDCAVVSGKGQARHEDFAQNVGERLTSSCGSLQRRPLLRATRVRWLDTHCHGLRDGEIRCLTDAAA